MDGRAIEPAMTENPYVGPRTFSEQEADRFFGREREARDLLSLVIADRLTLFYAQSGAGKSSLIHTRLIPQLRQEAGYLVLPVGRVGGQLPAGFPAVDNIYIFNLLLGIEQSSDQGVSDPIDFAQMPLRRFLSGLYTQDGQHYRFDRHVADQGDGGHVQSGEQPPYVLIIDQFEELVTSHPDRWPEREAFFRQVADAMVADPNLWVVLTMREDFVATLDPYAGLLPGGLQSRYYMQRMGIPAAIEAVSRPAAELGGRPFASDVAESLVDNLCQIRTTGQGTAPGQYVEPVQLQVVCYQLWEQVKDQPLRPITMGDLSTAGDVDTALANFYEGALGAALATSTVTERRLRTWFERELITEAGTRGFVYQGEESTSGMPNEVVRVLQDHYLLRTELRGGGAWVELIHDRIVSPIQESNRRRASPLTLDAEAWHLNHEEPKLLYEGERLRDAQRQSAAHPDEYSPVELAFVQAGLLAASQVNRRRRTAVLAASLIILSIVAVLLGVAFLAQQEADRAEQQAILAQSQAAEAQAAAQAVEIQAAEAQATAQAAEIQAVVAAAQAAESARATAVAQSETNAILVANLSALLTLEAQPVTPTPTGSSAPTPSSTTPDPASATVVAQATGVGTPESAATATVQAIISALQRIEAQQPVRQVVFGHSVLGQPLVAHLFGTGASHLVFVGGLHSGSAPASVQVADQAIAYFSANVASLPAGVTMHIIPNANPDSPTAIAQVAGRVNANGVDLNRNWDCNWTSDAVWANKPVGGGEAPFSEPEVQALRDYILPLRPKTVVFWEAWSLEGQVTPGGCNTVVLVSEILARRYGDATGYTVAPFIARDVTGDATNWLDAQGIPAIVVQLPGYNEADWENSLKAINALMVQYQ